MRMWMVDPRILCRKHLLGEHGEIHKFKHCFEKKYKMAGRMGQIDPTMMQERHDELAKEMLRRGYNHDSPYKQPDVGYLPLMPVDPITSLKDLFGRCPECKDRAYKLIFGQMFSPQSIKTFNEIGDVLQELDLEDHNE